MTVAFARSACAALAAIFAWPVMTQADYAVLHTFNTVDGAYPYGSLAPSGSTLYGVTNAGGTYDGGTLFQFNTQTGTYTVIHHFNYGVADGGANPYGTPVVSGSMLYGLAVSGGALGSGSLYRYNLSTHQYTELHAFANSPTDGAAPSFSSLTQSGNMLYGVAHGGTGIAPTGVVYQYNTATNAYTLLHTLTQSEGADPMCKPLLIGTSLYCTAQDGAVNGGGSLFKVDVTTGQLTNVHYFSGGDQGRYPWGNSVIASGSYLYGMTLEGGSAGHGTLYRINIATNEYTLLHAFTGGPDDGYNPMGSLIVSGSLLLGMTNGGGDAGEGVIFQYDTSTAQFAVLHEFAGPNDAQPFGDLLQCGDMFYGLTRGRAEEGSPVAGALFSFSVPEPSTLAVLGLGTLLLARRPRPR